MNRLSRKPAGRTPYTIAEYRHEHSAIFERARYQSQQDIALALGVTPSFVSHVLRRGGVRTVWVDGMRVMEGF